MPPPSSPHHLHLPPSSPWSSSPIVELKEVPVFTNHHYQHLNLSDDQHLQLNPMVEETQLDNNGTADYPHLI
ncbi:hypothetical protein Pmani_039803 [Petrolisthes manimaculis]|uniref:Uncharacterized protein n=1 Tax=Petrolisthes manimaculis TaxID=1843537 RepID=A0AAE1TKZ9_9EUCA|nr:hypothetical protein Pmani_039803 [Petrolisthes manimaculis]